MIWGLMEQRRCSGLRIPLSFLPEKETHLQEKGIPLSVSARFAPFPGLATAQELKQTQWTERMK